MITKFVEITALEDKPLELELAGFNLADRVQVDMEVIEPGKIFRIYFRNNPAPAGTFKGILKLTTNYPEKPEISVPIMAKFRKKVVRKNKDNIKKTDSKKS